MKARDVSAATAGHTGRRRSMILMGALVAFACAAACAALLGTGAPSAGADAACSNEAIRVAQHATQLGDCRAFERVSPVEKGDGDIVAEGESIVPAADGDAVTYQSRFGFADSVGQGNVGRTAYLARRGAGGWSTHAITPQAPPQARQEFGPTTHTEVFSSDLSRALAFGYDLPGASGSAPERMNMYLEDTATRALQAISSSQLGNGEDPIQYFPYEFINGIELQGASDDLRHVTLQSWTQFLPAGTAPGYPQGESLELLSPFFAHAYSFENVYTWDEGVLHLAGILPDGSAPPEGSTVQPYYSRGTMSADGSRQTFLASPVKGAPRQLYVRVDHERTALVSESENPAFTEEAQGVQFEGITPDGRYVFFVTNSPLLDEDENISSPDLYRWTDGPSPETEGNLTLITRDGGAVSDYANYGGALVGMSDDATRVYVHNIGGKLEVWQQGLPGPKVIDPTAPRSNRKSRLTLLDANPGFGRVSPDGNWFAYIKGAQMYLYDLEAGTPTCVSCPAGGLPAANGGAQRGAIDPELTKSGTVDYIGFRPHFLSDDGTVFFTSTAALLSEDTNGVADVYSYNGPAGKLSLVTTGKGSQPMEFAGAGDEGDDVFFVTRQQLVPSDRDEFVDLYDARVGGGFDEPDASASNSCVGDDCQGGRAAAPAANPLTSAAIRGAGNLKPHRCAAGKRKVTRHGRATCVKKRHKPRKHARHRRANRGGGK